MSEISKLDTLTNELSVAEKDVIGLINAITDTKSFVECDRFLRSATELGEASGEGAVCGFASIDDIDVGIFATNPNVLKGSIGKKNADKISKLIDNAVKTGTSVIGVLDTSGARFSEGIEALEGYSKIIKSVSAAYGAVPVIFVMKGNNYGLLSYLAGICDVCIAYEKSSVTTSSPLIISSKAGLDIAKVGSISVHAKESGLYSTVVKNDKELKNALSSVLKALCIDVEDSKDDANRVSKLLKCNVKTDVLIKEIFDTNSFVEMKKDYAPEVVTGFARLNGISVGVVASNADVNDGKLATKSCIKIAELLNTCEAFGVSIVNLVNCKGVINDIIEENTTLIREVANLLYLYNAITVPKVSLVVGNAIGAGYVAFAAKGSVDYSLAWENAQISAIDSVSAAELLFSKEIAKAKNKDTATKKLAESYAEENNSAIAVSKDGYIDNIIEPQFSRQYLIAAIQMFINKR